MQMQLPIKQFIFIIYKVKNFQLLFTYFIQVKSKRKYENQNLNLSTIYLRYHKAKTIKKDIIYSITRSSLGSRVKTFKKTWHRLEMFNILQAWCTVLRYLFWRQKQDAIAKWTTANLYKRKAIPWFCWYPHILLTSFYWCKLFIK